MRASFHKAFYSQIEITGSQSVSKTREQAGTSLQVERSKLLTISLFSKVFAAIHTEYLDGALSLN